MSIIIGNNNSNILNGTNNADIILGNNGNDTISGGGGSDLIDGGNGNDTINGGAGSDLISGGNGNDTVDGGTGNDIIDGGNGNDTLNGGAGSDLIFAGKGDDVIIHDATEANGIGDYYDGEQGRDTLRLIVSQSIYNSTAFQTELARFQSMINLKGTVSGTFNTLDFAFSSIERIEVVIKAPSNQAPTMSGSVAAADEDGPAINVNLAALGNDADSDDDGASLTYSIVGAPSTGSASISGTTLTFAPGSAFQDLAEGETRNVVIQVRATDSHGAVSNTANVTVTVTGTNDAPTMSGSLTEANEDGPSVSVDLSALGNDADSDDDGASLTYSIVGAPSTGSASISGKTLTFNPGAAFQDLAEGETRNVVIRVQATDSHGALSNTADVTVTVTGTNEAPTMSGSLTEANEDGPSVSVDLSSLGNDADSDDDGASLTYSIVGAPSAGSASISGTTLTFAPGSAFQDLAEGEARNVVIRVQATDSHGAVSNSADVTVTVTGTNDAPTMSGSLAEADEDGPSSSVDLSALGNDADGDDDGASLSYAIVGTPSEGLGSIDGSTLTFNPGSAFQDLAAGQTRDVVIQVQATDSHGAVSNTANVTVTVTGTNDAPTDITLDQSDLREDSRGVIIGALSTEDADHADTFTYTVDDPRFEIVEGNILKLKDTEEVDYEAEATITITVTSEDNSGVPVQQSFLLSVENGFEATAIDGYVAGATVFADTDGDGALDAGEAWSTTDAFGQFTLFGGSGPLVMFGGTDISTGKSFLGTMRAPEGSTVVTPLTTLVAAILDTATVEQPISASEANDLVLAGLGLTTGVDLSSFDPIAATISSDPLIQELGAASIAAAIQVQNTIVQAASVLEGAGGSFTSAATSVVTALAAQIAQAPSSIDLGSGAVISTVITSAAATTSGVNTTTVSSVVTAASQVITSSNQLVQAAASTSTGTDLLESLAQVSSVAQDAATSLVAATSTGDTSAVLENFTTTGLTEAVNAATAFNVAGTAGGVDLTGTNGVDTLSGSDGTDVLSGLGGNDVLQGLAGNDILNGGAGGGDRAVYTDATDGITVGLAAGTVSGAGVGTDTLLSVEMVRGSNFADTFNAVGFSGTSANAGSNGILNTFEGMGGDDAITGNGATILYYQNALAGVTVELGGATGGLASGTAQSTAAGDAAGIGIDTFTGISGIYGSAFNDTLRGSNTTSTVELFIANGGDDLIDGRGGLDRVNYASIVDNNVTGGLNIDMASGILVGDASVGTDTLRGIEFVRGSQFADVYVATGFSNASANAGSNGTFNEFEGVGGDDTITGNGNTRIAFYNATSGVTVDLLAGTATGDASVGSDTWSTTVINNFIGGINSVTGSQFADTLSGSNNAQGTSEQFEGRAGNDSFDGRGGHDTAVYNTDGTVNAGITVNMAAGTVTSTSATIGTDTLQGIEAIRATNFADTYDATGFGGSSANAGSLGTFNEFEGLGGNDIITGNGNTLIAFNNATAGVTVDLAAGTATGNGSVGTDTILGGVSRVRGSNFNDTITGDEFNNTLEGQNGNDIISGGGGNDTINGGANNDILTGGEGNDSLTGGLGGDDFVFADGFGFDTITDFNQAQADAIDLTGVTTVTDFATLQTLAAQIGANTVIDFGNGDVITLNNVTLANLTEDDFIFGEAVNPAPTDLSLEVDTVAENTPVGTVIGLVLVVDNPGDTLTFELLDNAGGRFALDGNNLVVAGALDHESAASHQITVLVTDSANNTYEETLTVNVSNVNEAPTDIALSASTVAENTAADTIVGTLSAIDPDASDTLSFELLDNAGGLFALDGNNLVVAGALDYETAVSHQITVRVTDAGGETHDEVFSIDVTNVNEAPTSISLTTNTIAENSAAGSLVGSLMAFDPDGIESATFTLLDNAGGLFAIDGNGLVVAGALDYETATSHQVTVQVTDGGGNIHDEVFTIDVTNESGSFTGTVAGETLTGTSEEDTIQALGGNDILIGGDGDDALNGGAGLDRGIYTDATGELAINLAAGTVTGAGVGTDTLQSIENIRGGNFADAYNANGFSGSSANAGSNGTLNSFEGMGGNDTITGNGSTIALYQNASAGVTVDLLAGTAQGTDENDLAGIGTDTLSGVVSVAGSAFNDMLQGSNLTTTIESFIGNGGNDLIDGRGGLDRANYATILDDSVTGGISIDMATGIVTGDASVGTDTLRGIEFVRGSQFADTYDATGFSNTSANAGFNGTFNEFEGMGGDDTITGNGNTRIAFYNATGGVTVDLAAGTSTGNASVGSDTITGGVNSITGSQFADTMYGSDNPQGTNEQFEGRAGNDSFDGRGGFDIAVYNNDPTVNAGIVVDLAAGTVTSTSAASGTDTLQGIESIRATNFDDGYDATGFDGTSANAGSFGNFNEFEGLGGNDIITGNGNTRISYINASGPVTVDMTTGIATGNASVGTDTFTGVSQVRGSNAGDTIIGNEFNNNLDGQGGNDTITGGAGNDTLTGGLGGDDFVFADGFGFDTITDFNQAQADAIDLTGVTTVTDFATLQTLADQIGANTVIDFGDGNALTLNNVTLANLTEDDFLFGEAVNPAPTDLSLEVNTVAENTPVGTVIGLVLVVDNPGDALTFELLDDAGGRFAIANGNNLVVAGALDHESAATHDITVRVTDSAGHIYEETLTVTVSNVNEAPTDIALSAFTIPENSAAATVIGTLSATDPDAGDTVSFALVDDAGGLFAIDGNNLVVAGALDYESAVSHQVTVQVTDAGGNIYDETFTIDVTNVSGNITGTPDADLALIGTQEEDIITAQGGDDILQGLAGNDILDGGAGNDRAVYSDATGGITVALAAGTVSGVGVGTDTLLSVESITGSNFADIYDATGFGPASTNVASVGILNGIEALGGDDTITGNGNTIVSYLSAAAGVTVDLQAGTGQGIDAGDVANVGTDTLTGVFAVVGSAFNDILRGSNTTTGLEFFNGNGGDDLIDGRGGFDRVNYSSILLADDTVTGGVSIDMASGIVTGDASVGTDTLRGIEAVRGSRFDDTYVATGFSGSSANAGSNGTFNEFEGMGGDDTITGNGNTRIAFYNATAGVTVDLLAGTATGDASVGNDTFSGVNSVTGSQFGDTLFGSNNAANTNEQFEGRAGNDSFDGRGGFDTAVYNTDGTVDAGITVDMAAGTVTSTSAAIGTDILQAIESIRATNFADSYDATGFGSGSANVGSLGTLNEFEGLGGNDTITGNGDTRIAFSNATAGVTVDLLAGTAIGNASVGTDTILGGVSRVRGSNFNDVITGSAGNDTIEGQGGADRAIYSNATGAITVNLAAGAVSGTGVGSDTLRSVENITGSDFDDTYNATGFSGGSTNSGSSGTLNSFEGMSGDDTVTGNGATILMYINATDGVTVDLAAGTASGDVSVGTDSFSGVTGITASAFNDTLLGSINNTGVELFIGGAGDDLIDGRGGLDRSNYTSILDDNVTGGVSIDMASGVVTGDASVGTDTLRSVEFVRGSQFADVYVATGFSGDSDNAGSNGTFNEFEGMGGNDTITGNGNTRIAFYNATSGVTVDLAAGTATGTSIGNDTFTAVANIAGSQFADTMYGSDNAPGTGEQFEGRAGNDFFDGRGGFDTAVYNNDGTVNAGITVNMAGGTVTSPSTAIGTDTLRAVESVRATNFADNYDATGFDGSSTNAGSFGDFNEFEGVGGNDIITGNGNTQIAFNTSTSGVTVDLAEGTAFGTTIGTDTILGGVARVRGSNSADTITGDEFNNILDGQGGNDVIAGGAGDDTINGGVGNDTITGGADNDTLTGGGGTDTFVFADGFGQDILIDFLQGEGDQIDLSGVTAVTDFATLSTFATQDGANTLIDFGNGDVITLNNVTLANLTQSDFLI